MKNNFKDSTNQIQEESQTPPDFKKLRMGGLLFFIIIIIFAGGYFVYRTFFIKSVIKSYEECIGAKGSIIQESYPQVCITKSGLRFNQEVTPVTSHLIKAEECYEKVKKEITNIKCPEGVDCMQANPETLFCGCMSGLLKMKDGEAEGGYGVCMINKEEYSGVTFQEFDQGWYWGSSSQKKSGTPDDWIFSGSGGRSDCWHKLGVDCSFIPTQTQVTNVPDYILEKSEGFCTSDDQCQWASQGCGGGHGICTNDSKQYENMMSTCDYDENFPANIGYVCGCVKALGRCGWKQ